MQKISYYNGIIRPTSELVIPLSDRAVFFGDGVYDMAVGRGGKIFRAEEHIERFFRSARAIGIINRQSPDDLLEILCTVARKSGFPEYSIYMQMSRSSKTRVHSYLGSHGVNLLVSADECSVPRRLEKIKLITAEDKRYYYCNVKTINLLPAVLASSEAEESGCDEAVLVRGGFVTECAHSNISILSGGVLYTHPDCELILPGITKKHLLFAAGAIGIKCVEMPFRVGDMLSADEVIVTSTTKQMRVATEIDGVSVGGRAPDFLDSLFGRLISEYEEEMEK